MMNLRRSVLLAAASLALSPLTLYAQEALRVVTDATLDAEANDLDAVGG